MTHTPDETKKGLECCMDYQSCTEYGEPKCPYNDVKECVYTLLADALAIIQQLEAQKTEQAERIHQLEAERDAAVKDCGCFPCQTCEERENGDLCRMCEIEGGYRSFHQWRGVQKEE